jgi:hypothetical protein
MLRTIFEPKMKEVTGGWRKSRTEELRNLYSSSYIFRIFRTMGGGAGGI